MQQFDIQNVIDQRAASGTRYFEFLTRDRLSAGVYHLAPGESDPQTPHTEDELYYVLEGDGLLDMEGEMTRVQPGSVIFIPRGRIHRFHSSPTGLTLLAVFTPRRGSGVEIP